MAWDPPCSAPGVWEVCRPACRMRVLAQLPDLSLRGSPHRPARAGLLGLAVLVSVFPARRDQPRVLRRVRLQSAMPARIKRSPLTRSPRIGLDGKIRLYL